LDLITRNIGLWVDEVARRVIDEQEFDRLKREHNVRVVESFGHDTFQNAVAIMKHGLKVVGLRLNRPERSPSLSGVMCGGG
jgi:hypothetical protein